MKFVFKIGSRSSLELPLELSFRFRRAGKISPFDLVGSWVIYYRSRLTSSLALGPGGGSGYFAVALVDAVEKIARPGIYRAKVRFFTQFDKTVPFQSDGAHFESGATHTDGSMNGSLIQRDIRPISDADFLKIVQIGLAGHSETEAGLSEANEPSEVPERIERLIAKELRSRKIRDWRFARQVCLSYGHKCAVTGASVTDPTGRSDLQAAHIRPVAEDGPDSVSNGFSCISSVHKLFDLGWLTLSDDLEIIVSDFARRHPVLAPLEKGRRLLVPELEEHRPHPTFLGFHRNQVFEHWLKGRAQAPYRIEQYQPDIS